jgi:hypothetical protein
VKLEFLVDISPAIFSIRKIIKLFKYSLLQLEIIKSKNGTASHFYAKHPGTH